MTNDIMAIVQNFALINAGAIYRGKSGMDPELAPDSSPPHRFAGWRG